MRINAHGRVLLLMKCKRRRKCATNDRQMHNIAMRCDHPCFYDNHHIGTSVPSVTALEQVSSVRAMHSINAHFIEYHSVQLMYQSDYCANMTATYMSRKHEQPCTHSTVHDKALQNASFARTHDIYVFGCVVQSSAHSLPYHLQAIYAHTHVPNRGGGGTGHAPYRVGASRRTIII